jgi:hypothetical protein
MDLDDVRILAVPLANSHRRAAVAFKSCQKTDSLGSSGKRFAVNEHHLSFDTCLCRKHVTKWSLTIPTACMCA